ncbi:MAG: PD-(D/E)XK nuclease family protein [Candidatus Cloacimonetes bacterium]|nr:PD-(D/E)XK nuclease family protein [Candidatus Cloacimonadota bacterium]
MKFKSIGLNADLLETAMQLTQEKSVLIFPTRIAAGMARQKQMQGWDFTKHIFVGMEEFKEMVVLPEAPILMDEKRLLCLYLVMGEKRREFFHILSYGDIVEWGRKFFDFFEELAEECIQISTLSELKESGVFHLQAWQESYLDAIVQIREDYFSYISAMGFTDKIFCQQPQNIVIPWHNHHLIFVNQYYYSELDKQIIQQAESAANEVTVLFHGLEVDNADNSFKVQEFELKSAWNSLTTKPKLSVIESSDEDQMAIAFQVWLDNETETKGSCAIIDSSFHKKSYSRYFDPQRFRLPCSVSFTSSRIYRMLTAILNGITARQQSGGYLPVSLLAKLVSTDWFVPYFYDNYTEDTKQILLNELAQLIKNDFLYVDTQLFDVASESALHPLLKGYFLLLNQFSAVSSIAELCRLLDNPASLKINRLLKEGELQHTDILPCFWERIANFGAIENLGLIPSWEQIFLEGNCGAGILELLLSFLKNAKISWKPVSGSTASWEISNLMDTRNRSFDKVVFFQMIEGAIPSNPNPVWLLNEAQRSKLGLKSYKDIRAWERYYFFRLLLCSKEAVCFSYSNTERDICPSSFLGELKQLYTDENLCLPQQKLSLEFKQIYQNSSSTLNLPGFSATNDAEVCCLESVPPPEFFILPSNPEKDFGAMHTLQASASGILQFIKNPFLWYIETKSHLQSLAWEAEETISSKLFGNLMHAYFAKILGSKSGTHTGLEELSQVFGNKQILQDGLIELINSDKFRYQIPKNYNADFLSEIISQRLAESLFLFYENWLKLRLERKSFCLIPESEEMTVFESKHKNLGSVLTQGQEYQVQLRGKADLRIETDTEVMIVDFKTGSHDFRQLIIYEWIY